ncbi:unnamed protein product [Urochloa humidicola]
MDMAKSLILNAVVLAACLALAAAQWTSCTAAFYGGPDGSGTMGKLAPRTVYFTRSIYEHMLNTALSQTLFNDGVSCGQCYTITCDTSLPGGQYCKPDTLITISATNLCPPSPATTAAPTSRCRSRRGSTSGSPRPASSRCSTSGCSASAAAACALASTGSVTSCLSTSKTSAAAAPSVGAASVKGDKTDWIEMSRNWGANWQPLTGVVLVDQALSFTVSSTGGQNIQFLNAAPAWWQFGQTYSTNKQFAY